jgi:hypothetical protein
VADEREMLTNEPFGRAAREFVASEGPVPYPAR